MSYKFAAHRHFIPFANQELKPSELNALKTLAKSGPLTGYDLPKKKASSLRAAYSALKGLKEKAYVECIEVGETRAGLKKKLYSLTFWGFCNALGLSLEYKDILECVRKWTCLDDVFLGNVDGLKETFGVNEVCEALSIAAYEIAKSPHLNEKGERLGNAPYMPKLFRGFFFNHLVNHAKYWNIESHVSNWNLKSKVKSWLLKWNQNIMETLETEINWRKRLDKALQT